MLVERAQVAVEAIDSSSRSSFTASVARSFVELYYIAVARLFVGHYLARLFVERLRRRRRLL